MRRRPQCRIAADSGCRRPRSAALPGVVLLGAMPAPARAAMSAKQRAAILAPTTDFTKAERWEAFSGGTATNRTTFTRDAFSEPSASLSFEERAGFEIGNGIFRREWVIAPASTQAADGLGPLYNARACQNCHLKDGRGHPPTGPDDTAASMFLRLSIPPESDAERELIASHRASVIPDPTYGGQLQNFAIPGQLPEGRMVIDYQDVPVELAGGETVHLQKPELSDRRSRLRPAPSGHHAEPPGRAADDRARPARGDRTRGHPGQRRPGRRRSRRHLRPAQLGLEHRRPEGRARALRLEGGRALARSAGRPRACRRRRRRQPDAARRLGRLHRSPSQVPRGTERQQPAVRQPRGAAEDHGADSVLCPQSRGPGAPRRRAIRPCSKASGCSTSRAASAATGRSSRPGGTGRSRRSAAS